MYCCILGCTSCTKQKGITFHVIPKKLSIRKRWILATGQLKSWKPSKNSRVCSKHFEDKYFTNSAKSRLALHAVPTLLVNRKKEKDLFTTSHNNTSAGNKDCSDTGLSGTGKLETLSVTEIRQKKPNKNTEKQRLNWSTLDPERNMTEVKSLEECRACLRKIDDGVCQELFQPWNTPWAIPGAQIVDDFVKLADIEISEFDKHSKVICIQCHHRLADACSFLIMAQRSDCILKDRLNDTAAANNTTNAKLSSWPQPILVNKNLNGHYDNGLEVEVKQEMLSEDEHSSNHMDLDWEPTMDIKIEPEEILAPVSSDIQVNGAYSLKDTNEEAIHLNGTNNYHEEYLDSTIKEEPASEELETAPDLPLDCMLCMKAFNSVTGLKAHVIAQHSYGTVTRDIDNCQSPVRNEIPDEFVCATCRKSFGTRTDLMVHEAGHGKHACFVCDAKFNTFRQLSRHSARCRPRRAPVVAPARPPKRSQKSARSNKNPSDTEFEVEPLSKKSEAGPSIAETKVAPAVAKLSKNLPSMMEQTKEDPVKKQSKNKATIKERPVVPVKNLSNNEISVEQTKVDSVKKQSENVPTIEETKVTSVQIQSKNGSSIVEMEVASIQENCENESSAEQTEVAPVNKELKNGPNVETTEEFKVTPVQKQSKIGTTVGGIAVEPIQELNSEPTIEESIVEPVQKQLINELLTEETEVELFQTQSPNEPSTEETQELAQSQFKTKSSIDETTVEPSEEHQTSPIIIINSENQFKSTIITPTCKTLQYQILYEDESLDSEAKTTEENISPCISVDSLLTSQDNSDTTHTNTCKEEPHYQLTANRIEHESCLQHPDQENSSSNEPDDKTNLPEGAMPNMDEFGQSMEVHLAINPFSEDPLLLENKMDIDIVSESSEPKLLNMTSEISDNSVTQ